MTTPAGPEMRLTECHCFTDEDYPYCNDRAMPCKYKDQFSRRKCPDYKSVIHQQVECDVRQGTTFAQQMVSDALGEPIYNSQHPYPEQCPHWECIEHSDGVEWCCNKKAKIHNGKDIKAIENYIYSSMNHTPEWEKAERAYQNILSSRVPDTSAPKMVSSNTENDCIHSELCKGAWNGIPGGCIGHDDCRFYITAGIPAQQRIADVIEKLEAKKRRMWAMQNGVEYYPITVEELDGIIALLRENRL